MSFIYKHEENREVTKAWKLIAKGQRAKALQIFAGQGCPDPKHEVQLI